MPLEWNKPVRTLPCPKESASKRWQLRRAWQQEGVSEEGACESRVSEKGILWVWAASVSASPDVAHARQGASSGESGCARELCESETRVSGSGARESGATRHMGLICRPGGAPASSPDRPYWVRANIDVQIRTLGGTFPLRPSNICCPSGYILSKGGRGTNGGGAGGAARAVST